MWRTRVGLSKAKNSRERNKADFQSLGRMPPGDS